MTRAFPDGHVIRADGITASFIDSQADRTPIILGTNRDESKLFNAMNQRLVVWDEAGGLYSFMGRMPMEILRPDYYDAISDYGSGFWKLRAADLPASQLVRSGHTDTFVYRFDWDELPEINNVDYARLIGAAHAMELLFIFGTALDNTLIKQLVVRDSYPEAQTLSDQMQSYWVEFAYTGDPGRGRSGDLPTWQSWSDEPGANKSMILDSTNDQGLMMSPLAYSETLLLDRLAADSRLNPRERCETLFALSWGDGDDLSEAGWNNFSNGECSRLDYSELIEQLDERSVDNES
jgi:para-nitrobenzyl esterase